MYASMDRTELMAEIERNKKNEEKQNKRNEMKQSE